MAQFAVLIYPPSRDNPATSSGEEREVHSTYAEDIIESGAMVLAFALEDATETAIALRAGSTSSGPFVEAHESVAGFYVLEAVDLDAALAIARRNPIIAQGGGVEVRPIEAGFVAGVGRV